MFARTALTATLLAFVSSAAAQLQIVSPGGPNLWWGMLSIILIATTSVALVVKTGQGIIMSAFCSCSV